MGLVSKPYTFVNNTTAVGTEVNSDFDTLYTLVNGNLDSDNLAAGAVGTTEIADDAVNFNKIDWGTGADQVRGTETTTWRLGQGLANYLDIASPALTGNRTWTLQDTSDTFVGRATTDTLTNKTLTTPVIDSFASATHNHLDSAGGGVLPFVPPIGSILPFYDFNGNLTFSASYWKYCDGSTHDFGGAVGVQTLPDLSNRYLVGFGTEGGGDIDSAGWATAAVGQASHQIDISHTHTGASHTHAVGTLQFQTATTTGGPSSFNLFNSSGTPVSVIVWPTTFTVGSGTALAQLSTLATGYTANGTGATASGGNGATSSAGSSTQTIQPRSIRCRFIMRVA